MHTDYPYRKGVNAIVVDDQNNFLLVQKVTYRENEWEFPGGGLEEGELPEAGMLRELQEELGSGDFEVIKLSPFVTKFEWPPEAIEIGYKKHGKYWRGQEKLQYIVKFTGNKDSLVTQDEEIRKIKWVKYSELKDHLVFDGQWENAKRVIKEAGLI